MLSINAKKPATLQAVLMNNLDTSLSSLPSTKHQGFLGNALNLNSKTHFKKDIYKKKKKKKNNPNASGITNVIYMKKKKKSFGKE